MKMETATFAETLDYFQHYADHPVSFAPPFNVQHRNVRDQLHTFHAVLCVSVW
jgi:hypothetical protein